MDKGSRMIVVVYLVCLLLHLLPRSVVVSLGEVWTPSPSPAPVSGQKLGLDFTIRLPPGGGRRKRQARAEYRGVAQTRVQLHLIRYVIAFHKYHISYHIHAPGDQTV